MLAFYIARWRSGLLPVAAAFAIILLIFCAISAPQWFARDKAGFEDPLLDESIVGILTILLVPLQILLIVVAARGFSQKWSVEVERRRAELTRLESLPPPGCWNWNTGSAQNRLPLRDCGFESHPGYCIGADPRRAIQAAPPNCFSYITQPSTGAIPARS